MADHAFQEGRACYLPIRLDEPALRHSLGSTVCILALFIGLVFATQWLLDVVVLVVTAMMVAYILRAPVRFVERGILALIPVPISWFFVLKPRAIAVFMVLFISIVVVAILALLWTPALFKELQAFSVALPSYMTRLGNMLDGTLESMAPRLSSHPATTQSHIPIAVGASEAVVQVQTTLLHAFQNAIHYLQQQLPQMGGQVLGVAFQSLTTLVYTLTGLVLVVYLLLDGKTLKQGVVSLFPAIWQANAASYADMLHRFLYGFIRTQVLLSMLAGVYLLLVTTLLDVPFAGLLSFVFGVCNLLPVIGPLIGLLPSVLVILFGHQPAFTLPVEFVAVAMYFVFKQYWLYPRLVGERQAIPNPMLLILTFVVCMRLGGLLAVLLAFPLASLLLVFYHWRRGNGRQVAEV